MARFSLGHLVRGAGQSLAAYGQGQREARRDETQREMAQIGLGLRMLPHQLREENAGAVEDYLLNNPLGRQFAGKGFAPSTSLALLGDAERAARERDAGAAARQAMADLRNEAQGEANFIARTNQSPSATGIYAALRADPRFRKLPDGALRGIAASAVGTGQRSGGVDITGAVQRVQEQLNR